MSRRERLRCRWVPGCKRTLSVVTESPISGLCCSMRMRMITHTAFGGRKAAADAVRRRWKGVRRVGGGAHCEQERAARRFFLHGWRSEGACLPRLRMPAGASTRSSEEAMQRSTARLRLWLLQRRRVREGQHPEGAHQRDPSEDQAQQRRKVGSNAQ